MKNAFLENHIFTEYNLVMGHAFLEKIRDLSFITKETILGWYYGLCPASPHYIQPPVLFYREQMTRFLDIYNHLGTDT